ncbi:MAG: hypothetical protein A2745_01665 [Candidatus Harrisonbacteria bacterium RIFCSPHIGHO2_01_FULL_44_13]|uniref:Uncharacterized protein n=1 Tax=Candidatus Harrisonbacteria bacterium RIFCSPLOWO2_01_FULL_44_18 TaxID=1798407 RepID=A0A1G1ZKM6_9BACT|nr:MAG: hypothetical protein A2745_01665 [Candidatus Harrisonbacteria bacterium RIFCSPHIGHO2_01_FULL_44_13]OGY65183.1 MAG: hypothetical protein A3A16_00625 [Candidatus Harrisonbacteria bacterium RIFCSPLOWO2_01_FULL_44_18]
MAFLIQFQRRAIESLKSHLFRPRHAIEDIHHLRSVISGNFTCDGVSLDILGVSKGVGTCSDIHGMDVLVLGWSKSHRCRAANEISLEKIKRCAYAVLLRQATEEEAKSQHFAPDVAVLCVELLRITDIASDYTNFQSTGLYACYAAI